MSEREYPCPCPVTESLLCCNGPFLFLSCHGGSEFCWPVPHMTPTWQEICIKSLPMTGQRYVQGKSARSKAEGQFSQSKARG